MRLLSQFLAPGEGPVRRNLPSLPQAEGGMSGVRRRCGGSSVVSSARGLGTLNTAPPNPSTQARLFSGNQNTHNWTKRRTDNFLVLKELLLLLWLFCDPTLSQFPLPL